MMSIENTTECRCSSLENAERYIGKLEDELRHRESDNRALKETIIRLTMKMMGVTEQ